MRRVGLKNSVSAVALVLILVLAITYLYSGVLNRSVTSRPDTITVSLPVTGGLYPGSGVTYRGVRIGTVEDISLTDDGVQVKARIDTSRDVPADSDAVVRSLSPAGEQFLDLQPRSVGGQTLTDGQLFGRPDTATPTSVASALGNMDRLIGQVDETKIQTILRELAIAFKDPDDLARLVDSGQQTLQTLVDTWPQADRLIRNGNTVLRTGVDKREEFAEFATSAKSLAAYLRDYDPTLEDMLDSTPPQLATVQTTLNDLTSRLPGFLDGTGDITKILADREQHLRALLVAFPLGADALASTLTGGRLNVNIIPTPSEVCSYGRELKPAKTAERLPVPPDLSCDPSFSGQQRGSSNTPPVAR